MSVLWLLATALAVALSLAQDVSRSVTDVIDSDDRLSYLGALLQSYPAAATAFTASANATFLAFTNDAWQVYSENTITPLLDVTSDFVSGILSYQVVSGTLMASDFTATPSFRHTVLTDTNYTNVTSGQVVDARSESGTVTITSGLDAQAVVVEADLIVQNGVVHIVDAVNTVPLNVSSTASASNLTAFLAALETTGLTETFSSFQDVTVFTPQNSAFDDAGDFLATLTTNELAQIMANHIVSGSVAYSPSISNGMIQTLGGDGINITVSEETIYVAGARVATPDRLVANGVMHVVDRILDPNATAIPSGGATTGASSPSNTSGGSAGGNKTPTPKQDKGLSSGAIAGIVIGALVLLGSVAALAFFAGRRQKRKQASATDPPGQPSMTGSEQLEGSSEKPELAGTQRHELASQTRPSELHGNAKSGELHTTEHASHELP